ncbi:MAG: methionyl-tRNA formyltransferase [Actinobacteria bacterium]|nr:methionyl-tRNA formyltransferase [Actinomycetota bacterium]
MAPQAPRRLVYLGSPEIAVAPLRALVDAGWDVALVVSQPDRKRGRGGRLRPTPVKAAAVELGLPVTDRVDDVLGAGADLGVVVAFGRLVRPHVLAGLAMVNLHFSLLPRWRGAAPVERAILAGDDETGVCLMRLEEGLDTGPVYACERVGIGPEETADELRSRLVALGTELLLATLAAGLGVPAPQQGEPTYAAKLDADELRLDWSRPAVELHRVVRVGGAWTTFRGRRLKVHRARLAPAGAEAPGPGALEATVVGTGQGALELVEVQPEGRAAQPAPAWLHGARPAPGERLGT